MTNQEIIQNEYLKNRYMRCLSDEEFMNRFNLVFENMCIIDDNGKISLGSVNSPERMFWFQHWIRICAEAELRTIYANQIANVYLTKKTHQFLEKIDIKKLKQIRSKTEKQNYLYKYGKEKFLRKIIEDGEIYIRPASFYSDSSLNSAIKDDELRRYYLFNQNYKNVNIKIQLNNENHSINKGIYKKTINSDYYVYCLAEFFDPRLFNDFDADSCLIIKHPQDFIKKIKNSLAGELFSFSCGKVKYFDPLLDNPFETTLIYSKNFAYSYQNEFRLAFVPYNTRSLNATVIKLSNIAEYLEIVKII